MSFTVVDYSGELVKNKVALQLVEIAKGLIDPPTYADNIENGDASAEYARGIIELIAEFAGFPLGDSEPREAVALAIGLQEVIS